MSPELKARLTNIHSELRKMVSLVNLQLDVETPLAEQSFNTIEATFKYVCNKTVNMQEQLEHLEQTIEGDWS